MRRRMDVERLSRADAYNVDIDRPDQVNAFQWVGLLGVGGFVPDAGAADIAALRTFVGDRLRADRDGTRRLSQRLVRDGHHWAWADAEPDLDWHVRVTAPVDGLAGLQELCARLATSPLAHSQPLWEMLIVPGAGPHGPALVARVHHALGDGVEGVRLTQRLFGEAVPGHARPVPGREHPLLPVAAGRSWWRGLARGLAEAPRLLRSSLPDTPLLGPIGPRRGVALVRADLAAVHRGARLCGATVNDALLASVAAAVGAGLRERGAPVPARLPVSVPVALGRSAATGNAVGLLVAPLSMTVADRRARLAAVSATTRAAKASARGGTLQVGRGRWSSRLMLLAAHRQRVVAAFVTDVRGPAHALSVAGAPLEAVWAVTTLHGNVRLAVSAFSYGRQLGVAIHADADALPVPLMADVLDAELTAVGALR